MFTRWVRQVLGVFLIISSAAMTLIVRFGGQMADRFQSRWLVMIGLFVQLSVMLAFAHLSDTISTWVIAGFAGVLWAWSRVDAGSIAQYGYGDC